MLIFGDNLQVMKSLLELKKAGRLCNADGTPGVRLVYIDPPFATKQDFHGTRDQKAYQDRVAGSQFLDFLRKRLVLLRELLADNGSFYLHLDPKKAHYVKALADEVFGEGRFRNEIVWPCTNAHNETKQCGRIHQVVFFYAKDRDYVWNPQRLPFSEAQLKRYKKDEKGRLYTCQDLTAERRNSNSGKFDWRGTFPSDGRGWGYELKQLEKWLAEGRIAKKRDGTPRQDGLIVYFDEMEGQTPQSIWPDVPGIANTSAERLDYPTQKPEALLARIIKTSSFEGDLIIHELHQREFTALKQPSDELAVNDTVEAVGFDFIRRPELEFRVGLNGSKETAIQEAFIRVATFKSEAVVREPLKKRGNRETLSMMILDYDFDTESDVFDLDAVF